MEQGLDQEILNVLIAIPPEVGNVRLIKEQENKDSSSSLPEWAGSYI